MKKKKECHFVQNLVEETFERSKTVSLTSSLPRVMLSAIAIVLRSTFVHETFSVEIR